MKASRALLRGLMLAAIAASAARAQTPSGFTGTSAGNYTPLTAAALNAAFAAKADFPQSLAWPSLTITQPLTPQTTGTINATDNGSAPWQYPKFNFIAYGSYTSMPGGGVGAAIQGLEMQQIKNSTPGVQTTGNWQAMTVAFSGTGGSTNDVFSAGWEGVIGLVNQGDGKNLSGTFIANNPSITIPTGFTPVGAYGEQIDNAIQGVPTFKAGLSIHDINNTVNGSSADASILVWRDNNGTNVGWFDGILFGQNPANFPIQAGGSFMTSTTSSVTLDSFLDFSRMSSQPTTGGILMATNVHNALCFGATAGGTCPGGYLGSGTTVNGGSLVFANNFSAFQFGNVTEWQVDNLGDTTNSGWDKATGFIATGSPPNLGGSCSANTQTGGNTAGTYQYSGACGAGTVTLAFATTAPTGWACTAQDLTTLADKISETAYTTTNVTLTGSAASGDTVAFDCIAF